MRKIIYIGQGCQQSVYYNTRTREALVADKSALLNTEGARKTNKAIIPLILLFALFGGGVGLAIFSFTSPFRLNERKATLGKIFFFSFVILVLLFCLGIVSLFGIPGMLIPYYNHEWFDLSLLFSPVAGVLPAVVVIALFQNNPIRWLLAVRKYEQRKVIFREEKN